MMCFLKDESVDFQGKSKKKQKKNKTRKARSDRVMSEAHTVLWLGVTMDDSDSREPQFITPQPQIYMQTCQ